MNLNPQHENESQVADDDDYINDEYDPTNVFVQNLPKSINDEYLENLCKKFGHVNSVKIMV